MIISFEGGENVLKKIGKILLVMILVLSVYVVGNGASIYFYSYRDETRQADVAIVLGASVAYNRVNAVYRERINHAVDLYNKKDVSKLILTGGKVAGQKYSDSEVAKQYALSKGVKEKDILIEESSKTTLENLIYAKKLMNQNNLKTALVVSDALHMRRAMLMAKDVGIDAYSSPTKTSMYKTTKKRVEFLKNETIEYILYKCYKIVQHFTKIHI